jgi:alpha-1,3-rhamnosyl/mannosyltransferase
MRVVIDATPLLVRSAGVKSYLYHWIKALRLQLGEQSVKLFPFLKELPSDLDHRASPTLESGLRLAWIHFCNVRGNSTLSLFPWEADVFHASQHLVNPPSSRIRLTATVYDMTCWLLPDSHQRANIIATMRYAERVLKRADACIAISEATRLDTIELLGIPGSRIKTIYPGVAAAFFNTNQTEGAARSELDKPYFLYVGTVEPRKNVASLLEAYDRLPHRIRSNFDLVVAGMMGWGCPAVQQRLETGADGIQYLGYVPEEALPDLTRRATALVFPSFYEGFGLPLAQAMAAGTPAITSYGSSLEEIAGGACLLVDPHSIEELTCAMQQIVDSPSLQQELSTKGRLRAQAFRWERNADESAEFFRSVAKR